MIARSEPVTRYDPQCNEAWNQSYERYQEILKDQGGI